MAYTFDFVNKIISVDVAPVANKMTLDIVTMYSAWKEAVITDGMWQLPAFRVIGGDSAGDNKSLGLWFYFINGWRFKPYAADHTLFIVGNLKVSDVPSEDIGGSPFVYPPTGNIHIETEFSLQALVSYVSGGSVLTTAEHNKLMEIPSVTLETDEKSLLENINTNTISIKAKTDILNPSGALTTEEHNKLMGLPDTTLEPEELAMLEDIQDRIILVQSGQISTTQFKSWLIERTNTITNSKITSYTAGSGANTVQVNVTYDSENIPISESIV